MYELHIFDLREKEQRVLKMATVSIQLAILLWIFKISQGHHSHIAHDARCSPHKILQPKHCLYFLFVLRSYPEEKKQ